MPLVLLVACAPLVCSGCPELSAAQSFQQQRELTIIVQESRGKLAWFRGSYEELLAEAQRNGKIVFLDFYSRTNAYSRKLEKSTYVDPRVVSCLSDVLCFSIDADTKDSKALRKRFQVQTPPALVFLDPDGTLRDQISGYFAPEHFLMELERIKANKDTFSDLRGRIARNADDLDSRWDLARKLRGIGDLVGFEEQIAEIKERDREGRTAASRRMCLSELYTAASARLELQPLYDFVQAEKDPELLFEGWWSIWMLEGQAARSARDPEKARVHELRYFAAARALWPLVPVEQHGRLGNNIAWSIYENRASATRSDLEFALAVAEKAAAAAPQVPAVVDTLACCLYAVGRHDAAREMVKRCIELDSQNPEWRERLAEFQKTQER